MKKILFTLLALITVAFGLQFSQVYADSANDLIDDLDPVVVYSAGQGSTFYIDYDSSLLQNSNYQLKITLNSLPFSTQDWDAVRDSDLEFDINGAAYSNYIYYNDVSNISSLTILDVTFSTTAEASIDIPITFSTSEFDLALFDSLFNIELYWLGNTAPVDEVDPEFSYSNLSVDTSYDDLITASEIQAQLHATDDEDGDVTSRIEIYEDHYTATSKVVGGDYYIMYRVSDTSGNYAYLRVDIEVIDDIIPYFIDESDNNHVYTNGSTFTFSWYDANSTGSDDAIAFVNGLVPWDEYYGSMNDDASSWIYEDSNTFSSAGENDWRFTPGVYHQDIIATDPSGNEAMFSVTYTVLHNSSPVISGPDSLTVEGTAINITNILAQYSATDAEDGTTSVVVSANNTWNYASNTLGNYTLQLSSTDSYGTVTTKNVTVHVVDSTVPVIKVSGIAATTYDLTVNMSNTSAYTTFINSITATDAYYGTITGSLVFPAVPSFALPGTVEKTITVTDGSGNTGSLVVSVTVVDDISPVINGAVKVVKGKTATMALSEITAQISAVDNVDGSISVQVVQDGYTGNATIVGSYLVKYKATDSSGNISYHDVRVWVVDNVAPVWVVDDFFINLGLNESMTRTELVALLQASGMVANDISYTVTFLTDEYTGNEELEGVYSVVMRVTYEDGSEDEISVQLSVPEDIEEGDVIVVTPEEDLTGLQKTIEWVKTAAVNIWNFIQDAWHLVKTVANWIYDNILYPIYEFIFVKDTQVIPDTIASIRYYFAR